MSGVRRAISALDVLMAAVFAVCVALQYNDPDPYVWMPMYGAACLACILFAFSRLRPWMSAAVGLFAFVWASTIAPRVIGKVRFADMFESMQAHGGVEEAREMGGLLIVAAWMLVLVFASRRRSAGVHGSPPP